MIHYCFNCGHTAILPDGTHCTWCLDGFARLGTMPRPHNLAPARDALSRAYSELGWVTRLEGH